MHPSIHLSVLCPLFLLIWPSDFLGNWVVSGWFLVGLCLVTCDLALCHQPALGTIIRNNQGNYGLLFLFPVLIYWRIRVFILHKGIYEDSREKISLRRQ